MYFMLMDMDAYVSFSLRSKLDLSQYRVSITMQSRDLSFNILAIL